MAHSVDPHDCVLIVYADNIFIAARSKVARDAAVAAVGNYLHAHPAGPFRLHKEIRNRTDQPFEFLGYDISIAQGNVSFQPTHAGFERMFAALETAELADMSRQDGLITETEQRIRTHAAGYPMWDDPDQIEAFRGQAAMSVEYWRDLPREALPR
jgi:hypothetical protein